MLQRPLCVLRTTRTNENGPDDVGAVFVLSD